VRREVDDASGSRSPPGLGFDPNAVLLREPGWMLEPSFLGALHAEIERDLGAEAAPTALVQIGLLHGLRDALHIAGQAFARGRRAPDDALLPPALALDFDRPLRSVAAGALELRGRWPRRGEASARIATAGPSDQPACFLSAGYTSGWLSGVLDRDVLALETTCCTAGGGACAFVAREAGSWRALGDPRAVALLDALPFASFRSLVRADCPTPPTEPQRFDPEAAVIHIWGPVMVIPYAGADEALRAVELIGRDAGARNVTVVVLDLTGAIVDDAFGAAALEQITETAEAAGAETIFAGLSPLSASVVADLDRQPLFVHKDVEAAIAAAFRIADAQRRAV
jgi:predicted hydrocarbon binding protein/anti-anti-sigma regulatory factor